MKKITLVFLFLVLARMVYGQTLDSLEIEGYMVISYSKKTTCTTAEPMFKFLPYPHIQSVRELIDSLHSEHLYDQREAYTSCHFPNNGIYWGTNKQYDHLKICDVAVLNKVLYDLGEKQPLAYEIYYTRAVFYRFPKLAIGRLRFVQNFHSYLVSYSQRKIEGRGEITLYYLVRTIYLDQDIPKRLPDVRIYSVSK